MIRRRPIPHSLKATLEEFGGLLLAFGLLIMFGLLAVHSLFDVPSHPVLGVICGVAAGICLRYYFELIGDDAA